MKLRFGERIGKQARMNQHDRQQLRIGYILLTLIFIGPFAIVLAARQLFGTSLPAWAMIIVFMVGAALFIEVLDHMS